MGEAQETQARELPRGRHRFAREAVTDSQRRRMLAAVAEAVADKGYAATTVADVVGAAAVSRRTFYEQFADLEACFLAAYRDGMEWLLEQIRIAVRAHPAAGWRERARIAVEAYLDALAARPAAARAFSIEALGGGQAVLAHRAEVMRRWMQQWAGLERIAGGEGVGDDHLLLLVGGIEELVRECLVTGDVSELPLLADRITEISVSTLER